MRHSLIAIAMLASFVATTPAQVRKKVFISADMEGISGISGSDQLSATGAEYARSRKLMADDVNAAIQALEGLGQVQIVVNDSHGSMRNLRLEDLRPSASLISHSFKKSGMMEGLDETFDGAIFIGYHAQAGTGAGLFAHTGSGVVKDVRVNGKSLGEGGLNTMVAAWYGVPVLVVTGDDVAVKQVTAVATDARGVVTKRAINQRAVELRPLDVVHREIASAVRDALPKAQRFTPRREASYTVDVQFVEHFIPDVAENLPGMQRPAPDTIRFTTDSMPKAYTLIRLLYRYINPD